jgi:hypothetical protein
VYRQAIRERHLRRTDPDAPDIVLYSSSTEWPYMPKVTPFTWRRTVGASGSMQGFAAGIVPTPAA